MVNYSIITNATYNLKHLIWIWFVFHFFKNLMLFLGSNLNRVKLIFARLNSSLHHALKSSKIGKSYFIASMSNTL